MKPLVLDTSVLVEYIIKRSPHRETVSNLLEKASLGELDIYITTLTLSELLYITSRIYEIAGLENPNREALDYLEWIKQRTRTINITEEIAIQAGELKKHLHLALADCTVIAAARTLKATPVFKKMEKEMKPVAKDLRRLGVKYLNELKPPTP